MLKGEDVGMRMTMNPAPASRWQRLHASVRLVKALVKSALFFLSIALPISASGGPLSSLINRASGTPWSVG